MSVFGTQALLTRVVRSFSDTTVTGDLAAPPVVVGTMGS